MSEPVNRKFVILGAILVQLSLALIHAWSVFTPSLIALGWDKTQTQMVFSTGMFSFALVMLGGGYALPLWGPRKVTLLGGFISSMGYILGGIICNVQAVPSPLFLAISIGVIGGGGTGLAYVVPIAVGMRWYPDKKGMITGLAVAGFGLGAMGWVKLAGSWGNLLVHLSLGNVFILYGIIEMLLIALGSIWMKFPPAHWMHSFQNTLKYSGLRGMTASEMLTTPQFYIIFITFMISGGAGLMTIGLMKLFPKEALQASGMGALEASALAGTAMALFFSPANSLGRITWGMLSDTLGRQKSVVIMCISQGVVMILFTFMAGTPLLLFIAAALIGFNFGGNFALFPTLTADIFGSKHIGQLYGWVFLANGIGGVIGPMLGGKLGDNGQFPLAFTIFGILCILAGILIALLKPLRTTTQQSL